MIVSTELEATFDARARELSRSAATPTNDRLVTLLTFTHGEMRFAVEPHCVARVLRDPKLTRIPKTPRHLSHVFYEAGRVVSVVSPVALFGASVATEKATRVVLLEVTGVLLGLEADRVVGLLPFETGRLTKPTAALEPRVAPCVRGIGADLTTVLDGAALTLALREH